MYANIKNFTKTTRKTIPYDKVANPTMESGMFVTIDPVTKEAVPIGAAGYTGSGVFGMIFKGTEEQVVKDTGKLDIVFGPSYIITDNWNTATALNPGDPVNIEWDAANSINWLDTPSGANIVGHVIEVTADNKLAVDFRQS